MTFWCVGRNYADHAKELGNPVPTGATDAGTAAEPMIFMKAGSTAVAPGRPVRLPAFSDDVHHELEIALRFGQDLSFTHLTIALDLTARDVQSRLKAQSHPWTLAKSFIDSCPLGEPVEIARVPGGESGLDSLEFRLLVNGELRQRGHARDMIFKPPRLRSYLKERFPVREGDWLLTGTPAGVARLHPGDRLEAEILGICKASWAVGG